MVDALHHVCDHRETSNELWRVLTRGGRIVIEEPNINVFSVKMLAMAEKLALMRSSFIPPSRIQSLFDYPNAKTRIDIASYNAWIIIDKT
jgi:demethylmenaquinone methyltransferase/2-methoxy-6-polyprenyl-1,4-benzoquinol methylase